MTTLRLVLLVTAAGSMAVGCGDDSGRGSDRDSGMGGVDAGPRDGGGGTDAPMTTDSPMAEDTGGGTGMCPAGECDLLTGTGCAMAGQSCYFLAMAMGAAPMPVCQMGGTGGDGASCTDYTMCREGFFCDTEAGVCRHYCCGDSDMGCPVGQTCAVTFTDGMGTPLGVGYCKLPDVCDPIDQTGCMGMQACYPSRDGFACATPGTTTEAGSCMFANDCAGGFICANSPGQCMKLCRLMAMPSGCAMGQTCSGLMGIEGIGVCNPPMGS